MIDNIILPENLYKMIDIMKRSECLVLDKKWAKAIG